MRRPDATPPGRRCRTPDAWPPARPWLPRPRTRSPRSAAPRDRTPRPPEVRRVDCVVWHHPVAMVGIPRRLLRWCEPAATPRVTEHFANTQALLGVLCRGRVGVRALSTPPLCPTSGARGSPEAQCLPWLSALVVALGSERGSGVVLAGHAELVALRIGEGDPAEVLVAAPSHDRGSRGDQPIDLTVEVWRGQVEVDAVLARRRVVDLLEGEQGWQSAALETTNQPSLVWATSAPVCAAHHCASDSASLVSMVTIPNVSVMRAKLPGHTDISPRRRGSYVDSGLVSDARCPAGDGPGVGVRANLHHCVEGALLGVVRRFVAEVEGRRDRGGVLAEVGRDLDAGVLQARLGGEVDQVADFGLVIATGQASRDRGLEDTTVAAGAGTVFRGVVDDLLPAVGTRSSDQLRRPRRGAGTFAPRSSREAELDTAPSLPHPRGGGEPSAPSL